jgi:N-acetylneuraminate synthase
MTDTITINGRVVGAGQSTFIVAEVAQAHDGSLGLAHAFIDAAAEVGADAVKFQTHIAAAESTLQEQFRVKFSSQDATRYDYWKRMEFTAEQWQGLARHAQECKLVFLSSAFSSAAIRLLQDIGMPAWKIASGEVASQPLLLEMIATGKPLIVSTGMSPWSEIEETVRFLKGWKASFCLLQCTSRYPTPLKEVGLNVIGEMRKRFGCPVGLSDHSGKAYPALAALALGCDVLELHLTLDRHMFGPDVGSSLTVDEFRIISQARDAFATMNAHPVDKDRTAQELMDTRRLFMRSAAPTRDLPAGTVLSAEMICAKKPGTGIPAERIDSLIGRRLARAVRSNELFSEEDFSET